MTIESLKKLIDDDGLSLETEEALLDLVGSRTSGEFSQEEEKKVREILEWETDSLNTKAQFYEDLAGAADDFVEKIEEENTEPDYEGMINEFVSEEEKEIDNLKKILDARIDLIGSDL
ncbi:hypothetical protein A2797_00555 [candidate division WWE3 bacterium RIFCSPHIGHO2_01_FULL_48_15]|uniref:Uncharacterized protein n=1 Tax=candidate division WWE3 bacterium RIFCSPHIGHO2_01_FULL_48_15 TaxID=1802619 RepID=A0A1F4VC27_UNCKA|nr:MAG: hypothetical protein A2797_00555 [candidate division WWE3 bacterium RIFCSPHIGHO2_01_FULL_48_15]